MRTNKAPLAADPTRGNNHPRSERQRVTRCRRRHADFCSAHTSANRIVDPLRQI